jgi:hypothetical protein
MKLPGGERAVIEPVKVRDYLLSSEHPVGRSKAHFFMSLGFDRGRWPELQIALYTLAQTGHAVLGSATEFGQKYVVRGILKGPTGRSAHVESVWMVPLGGDTPRLLTAYPGDRK